MRQENPKNKASWKSEKGKTDIQKNNTMFSMTHKLRTTCVLQPFVWHVVPFQVCN